MTSYKSDLGKNERENFLRNPDNYVDSRSNEISWLLNNLPITVFRASGKLSWRMDYLSDNVEKLTGYSKQDFIDQKLSWSDIVFPEDIVIIDKAVKKAKKNKSSYQIEYRIQKLDGSTAFVQEQANLIFDDSGKLAYIAGVFLNLTLEVKIREDSQNLAKEDEKIQLEILRSFVENLSRGEIPEPITNNYNGDLNEMKNNINSCIEGLQGLVECNNVLQRMALNDHRKGVVGQYVGIYASMGEATNDVRDHLLNVTKQLNHIAVGNTSKLEELKKIGKLSEQDLLQPAIIKAMESVDLLIDDARMLSSAAIEGKLNIRADVSKHHGWYKKIVQGFNDTLDAVIVPLNVAAEYVDQISKGEIPQKINDDYKGDFDEIKNNLNNCIDGLQGLVECSNVLQRMYLNDHTNGVEGNYVGIYATMGESINGLRERLLSIKSLITDIAVGKTTQLENFKKIGRLSEQDELMPAFIRMMETINLLIEDTGMLSRSAVEGKLDTRVDVSRHQGEYRKVVQGINDTLDAVTGPMNVAAEYVERISRGDIPEPIMDKYNGDFNEIKKNLNTCIDAINKLIEDSLILSEAGVSGQYEARADITRHEGDFCKIISGFNDTLDAITIFCNIKIGFC